MNLEVDQIIWFILLGILFTGYAILDGFDLGVGMLHVFVQDDTDRRLLINSIGPIWDGNEVWLVTGGGGHVCRLPLRLRHPLFRLLSHLHGASGGVDLPGRLD